MHALLHDRIASTPKPGLVVDLGNFAGYEDLSAALEDLKMDAAHRNDFSRVAVVGSREWMELGTELVKFLTSADMRWFDIGGADEALEWVREGR